MSLRVYKLVVPDLQVGAFAEFSKTEVRRTLEPFTKPDGVRFSQSRESPMTFFLSVWWLNLGSSVLFDESNEGKILVDGVKKFLAERLVFWDLTNIDDDYDVEKPVYYDNKVFMRLSKVTVRPNQSSQVIKIFNEYTNAITRKQPGCLTVKLDECTNAVDTYFVFSIWATPQDFLTFSRSLPFMEMKEKVFDLLENRIVTWNLNGLITTADVRKVLGGVLYA